MSDARPFKRQDSTGIRAFIATALLPDLSSGIFRQVIAPFQKEIRSGVKWVKPDGIHLTYRFLGNIQKDDVGRIQPVLLRISKQFSPINIEVSKCGAFPNLNRPRVLWVGVSAPPSLIELGMLIEKEMVALGFPSEERRFSPHLTIGRLREDCSRETLENLKVLINQKMSILIGEMVINEITLFQSVLKPEGAAYMHLLDEKLNQ